MKKIPLRKCTGCGEMKPKRELIRVVRAPDQKDENGNVVASGGVSLDLTGKKSGRGAYVCHSAACFKKARKANRFAAALEVEIPADVLDALEEEISRETPVIG